MWGLAHYIAVYCKYTDNGVSKLQIINLCDCCTLINLSAVKSTIM